MAPGTTTSDPDAIDDDDNPELTEADFVRSRPFSEVHPARFKPWKKQGGRPAIDDREASRIRRSPPQSKR